MLNGLLYKMKILFLIIKETGRLKILNFIQIMPNKAVYRVIHEVESLGKSDNVRCYIPWPWLWLKYNIKLCLNQILNV